MTIKTDNFNPKSDIKLLCTCGRPECDKRSVNQFTLDHVQAIRDDFNKPMIITSGGRCKHHPDEINKANPGDHQKCTAVDVFYGNIIDRNKLMVLAGRHGATRVAVGKAFVHMAWTETDDLSVPSWEY